jgi:hypothetical protein
VKSELTKSRTLVFLPFFVFCFPLFAGLEMHLHKRTLSPLRATERSEVPPLAGLRRFAPRNDMLLNAFVLLMLAKYDDN